MPSNPESFEFFRIKKLFLSPNSSMSAPSSSSSSATTITTTTVRCLAGILRRMLCSRSLPTHPTDHITESSSVTACEGLEKGGNRVGPSVVAKLMGLDSTPNSITRSLSMNSIDYCKGKNDPEVKGEHVSLKSTLSFREKPMPVPTFFELENEEFFVLSFEGGREKKGKRLKERKCEKVIGELKQISENSCVSPEFVEFSTPKNNGAKLRKKKKKKKKKKKNVELECSSEESSPVSVLDFDQVVQDHEVPTSDSMESNSRRKLSPEPENYKCQSRLRNDNSLMIVDDLKTKKADGRCVGSTKKGFNKQIYLHMCDQICRVAEAEILESNWICSRRNILKHEYFEDIYADFESQILDQLLHELLVTSTYLTL